MTIRKIVHVRVCETAEVFVQMWVCVKANGCPQHLSGKLAVIRALPTRAGKRAVKDLRLHASALNNIN